jgi:hypothetical protein
MTGTRQTDPGGRHRVAVPIRPRGVSRRTGRALLAGSLAIASATGGIFVAQSAGAAVGDVPSFPDNIVVFPDRDFVSVEGYESHAGETATIEVTRGSSVIGSAKALVDGGGVAFEINHPGGFCWGAGTGLNVTPDIKAGDKVKVTFPDGTGGTTTTSSAKASDAVLGADGVTVTIGVTLGADVNPAQVEQRIVEPALLPYIGRRDARAVPGPTTPAPKGGYSSSLEAVAGSPGSYVATYTFDDPAAAKVAANASLGERAMSWQVEDLDANRQGLTIAEFGEFGGPGFGGCPLGPNDVAPAAGEASATQAGTTLTVNWTPATNPPGTAPITNYVVTATDSSGAIIGQRAAATATQAKLTVLAGSTYTVEVRSQAGTKLGDPFPMTTAPGGGTGGPPPANTVPPLTLNPAGSETTVTEANSVTATTTGASVFFTEGDVPVLTGDMPSDAATLVGSNGSIPITKATTLNLVAIDGNGVHSPILVRQFTPVAAPTTPLAAPANVTATAGQASATVKYGAVPGAENYQVKVYTVNGTTATPSATI